jgi:hypothetical protein
MRCGRVLKLLLPTSVLRGLKLLCPLFPSSLLVDTNAFVIVIKYIYLDTNVTALRHISGLSCYHKHLLQEKSLGSNQAKGMKDRNPTSLSPKSGLNIVRLS